jgi:hypothetical protein
MIVIAITLCLAASIDDCNVAIFDDPEVPQIPVACLAEGQERAAEIIGRRPDLKVVRIACGPRKIDT